MTDTLDTWARRTRRMAAILKEAYDAGKAAQDLDLPIDSLEPPRDGEWLDGFYEEGMAAEGELAPKELRLWLRLAGHYLETIDDAAKGAA